MPTTKASAKHKPRRKHARDKRLQRGQHGGIELLLIQSVDHLGKQGEVVEVKRGYAMNYLLPQGLATVANDHHKRMVEKHKAKLLQIQHERLAGLRQLADRIGAQSVTIEANANDEGHLYGSVGAPEIVRALKQQEITVTSDQVRLKGPLKELGLYTVEVHLGQEIEAQLKVWVVPTVGDAEGEIKPEAKEGGAKASDSKESKSAEAKSSGKKTAAKGADKQ
ncbi:MAG TPA: 50S ribosomal protein L9 [Pirellulales bacterium]|jgi:large subunit ribosomal protein L9|nr:50S ribosomal protein L9 [Pirellulales bacterium]